MPREQEETRRTTLRTVVRRVAVVLLVAVALVGCAEDVTSPRAAEESTAPVPEALASPAEDAPSDTGEARTTADVEAAAEEPTAQSGETAYVAHIVDGDTIRLGNGETVRIIGIDTPERGECGFRPASDRLRDLINGKSVTLTPGARDDRDRYGRLLRYVDLGSMDAGLVLIEEGFAIARYDSRDGYGRHPREDRYVRADRESPDVGCAETAPSIQPFAETSPECAPGYSPCIPPYPPDLNCSDVDGPIIVTGDDPHRLDRDGDGIGCE